MKIFLVSFIFSFVFSVNHIFAEDKVSHTAIEVIFEIKNGEIDLDVGTYHGLIPNETIQWNDKRVVPLSDGSQTNLRGFIRDQIIEQMSYLYGIFQSPTLTAMMGATGGVGTPGESHYVANILVKKTSQYKSTIIYYYRNKGLADKAIFEKQTSQAFVTRKITFPSTTNSNKIYNTICTNTHYNSFSDYWYFFDPYKKNCRQWLSQEKRSIDLDLIIRQPSQYEKSQETYPEYNKLYKDNLVSAFIVIGYDGSPTWLSTNGSSPNKDEIVGTFEREKEKFSKDAGMETYKKVIKQLKDQGFETTFEQEWFAQKYINYINDKLPGFNHFMILERKNETLRGVVAVMLADTSVTTPDLTFAIYWKMAIENYEIINYAGHSGLGSNLDIRAVNYNLWMGAETPINFKQTPYQIYFFNGCSTYAYYNKMYFRAKGGTEYMESITTGLPSYFGDGVTNTITFVSPFLSFVRPSYTKILEVLESTNVTNGPALLFVNGDSDNPLKAM